MQLSNFIKDYGAMLMVVLAGAFTVFTDESDFTRTAMNQASMERAEIVTLLSYAEKERSVLVQDVSLANQRVDQTNTRIDSVRDTLFDAEKKQIMLNQRILVLERIRDKEDKG